MRFFLQLNFNGANYFGWQLQPGHPSVQGELTEQLSTLLNRPVAVTGCGRTDAGVHARQYFAHFDIPEAKLPADFSLRLNKMLPSNIGIASVFPVREDAHVRFDAIDRTYKYFIHFRKDAFLQERSFWIHSYAFDLDVMNEGADVLLHHENFRTFEKKGSDNKSSLCRVKSARWEVIDDNCWSFTITANRFLRNMVRRITGALLMTGIGTLTPEEIDRALANGLDLEVKIAPPAHGLFLWAVSYPDDIYLNGR